MICRSVIVDSLYETKNFHMWVGGLKAINNVDAIDCLHSTVLYLQTVLASDVEIGYGSHRENAFCGQCSKGLFFSESENISSSLYYCVIETLWKVSPVDDRKAVFGKQRPCGLRNTRPNETARDRLFSQADQLGNHSQEQLCTIVFGC